MISKNMLVFFSLFCFLSFNTRVGNSMFLGNYCQNNAYDLNSTTGSTYRNNLNLLLSTLSLNASQPTTNGFYNFTAGRDPSNMVYGLFLCRGDVNTDVCGQCVADASTQILQRCPDQTTAIIWYDECLLRYANQSMFGRADSNIIFTMWNTENATDPNKFNQILENAMDEIANSAANDRSGKKFAVREAEYTAFQRTLYALGQCTPDLSSLDCENCLRNAIGYIPRCCNNRQGGRVIYPSCNIRYELYRFYNTATPPPPPSPPGGKSPIFVGVAVAIALSVLSIALFIIAFVFLKRRSRKPLEAKLLDESHETDGDEILTIDP